LVRRFGSTRVLVPGLVAVILGLALLSTTGVHTSFFPTIFFAYFVIGLGAGSSFMPLLTMAMADVPASDAGLGSGIVNVSMQVAGALGLAVLGTLATNHSKALEAQGHALASSLVSGYHLAFEIGAACVLVGIVVAFAALRPLDARSAVAAAAAEADSESAPKPERSFAGEPEPQIEPQAA
jgi:MFS family permease